MSKGQTTKSTPAPPGRTKVGRPRSAGVTGSGDPRHDVLAAAGKLFFAKGVGATSMAEIAAAAGLQPPSLYYWFRNKTAILGALVAEANRVPLGMVARVNEVGGPAGARLWTIICLDVEALSALPFDINEVHRMVDDGSPEAATYWAERQQLIREVEAIVAEGVASGEFRPVDPRLTALSVLASDEGSQNWHRPAGGAGTGPGDEGAAAYSPRQIGEHLADLTLRGLLSRPSGLASLRAQAQKIQGRTDSSQQIRDSQTQPAVVSKDIR